MSAMTTQAGTLGPRLDRLNRAEERALANAGWHFAASLRVDGPMADAHRESALEWATRANAIRPARDRVRDQYYAARYGA